MNIAQTPWPLGVSSSVFAKGPDQAAVEALAASSVAALELVQRAPNCPLEDVDYRRDLLERLRQARVTVRSVHLPFGRAVDISQTDDAARLQALTQNETNLRIAAATGATIAVLHPSYERIEDEERAARIDACRRSLPRLAQAAASSGLQLAVECLPRTCLANTSAELLSLIADLDPAVVGVCIDVNHLNLRERDIAAAVGQLGSRLLTTHCSDNDGLDERHWLPGSDGGVVDWPAYLGALRATGYTGPFLYEVRSPAPDPSEALRVIETNYARLCGLLPAGGEG
jgi:sugar phosphate isomerase/epimerase